MVHFFDLLGYATMAMVSGIHGLISLLLVINLSVATISTKAWRGVFSAGSSWMKVGILVLLPFLILFLGALLEAPAGQFRSNHELQPIVIYVVFLLNLFLAARTVYELRGFRWFASGICLLTLWFSFLCVVLSLIAVRNLFV